MCHRVETNLARPMLLGAVILVVRSARRDTASVRLCSSVLIHFSACLENQNKFAKSRKNTLPVGGTMLDRTSAKRTRWTPQSAIIPLSPPSLCSPSLRNFGQKPAGACVRSKWIRVVFSMCSRCSVVETTHAHPVLLGAVVLVVRSAGRETASVRSYYSFFIHFPPLLGKSK